MKAIAILHLFLLSFVIAIDNSKEIDSTDPDLWCSGEISYNNTFFETFWITNNIGTLEIK